MAEVRGAARRLGGVIVAALLAIATPPAVAQEAFAPGLCVVPVKGSITFSPYDNWLMVPFPNPILQGSFPYGRKSLWTVSADNALVPLGNGFPYSWLDKFAVEVTSGRVLGLAPAASGPQPGIYVFDLADGLFRLILPAPYAAPDGAGFRFVNTIAYVPRLDVTLIGTDNGVFRLRGEAVEPWAGATGREVGEVHSIADLPVHGGLMLAGARDAMLRHDDGSVEKLLDTSGGWFSRADQVTGAVESKQPGRIVAKGVFADREVEMRPRRGGGYSSARDWTLTRHPEPGGESHSRLTRSGEYLLLVREAGARDYVLKRLEATGMRPVPGDSIRALAARSWEEAVMTESVALGLVLIGVKGGWYAYDGNRVGAVFGPTSTGIPHLPADMPSIGKTLLKTDQGLLEFTPDRRLVPAGVNLPSGNVQALSELASAGVGLIATTDNLYALARDGTARPIRDAKSDAYDFQSFFRPLPSLNAMLVRGRSSLHLIRQGPACPETPDKGAP